MVRKFDKTTRERAVRKGTIHKKLVEENMEQ